MKFKFYIISSCLLFGLSMLYGQTQKAFKHEPIPDNFKCFICHGNELYIEYSSDSSQRITMPMCSTRRLDTILYLNSIHGGFTCSDCHSQDYQINPHPAGAKFEPMLSCIDCHGGNEKFIKYHFEEIDSEYQKSVHALKIDNFSCWKCHNAHEYKNVYVSTQNIKATISVANQACFNCHEDGENYSLYSTKKMKSNSMVHDWLPNQDLHFKSVRCIDCHSTLNDSIATPHDITTAYNAVKNCTECHSDESRLAASLYKYKMRESRKTYGFINAAIINDAYVIGANRNHFLNIASIVIFSIIVLAILVHIMLRFIFNKKYKIHG